MSCTGLKRKLRAEDEDEVEAASRAKAAAISPCSAYSLQQQAVLQLSLQKLCCVPPHCGMALVRRVLITNTLRYIQQELSHQGGLLLTPLDLTAVGAVAVNSNASNVNVDGSRESPWGRGVEALSRPEGSLTPAWVLEQDGELFFSLHSSVARATSSTSLTTKDGFSTALAEIEDLGSALPVAVKSASSVSSLAFAQPDQQGLPQLNGKMSVPSTEGSEKVQTASSDEMIMCEPNPDSSTSQVPLSSSSPSSSNSFLPELSLDDFLFSDIDNFLCDYSPCSSSLNAGPSSSSKVISMVTDDLMRSLANSASGVGGSAPLQQNQPFKTDLNELDHIMEVLVGS